MSKDSDYSTMLNKYNRLLAQQKDLKQQIEDKEKVWKTLEYDFETDIAIARELCEKILAKNPSEMVLGQSYSWRTLGARELLRKAIQSFDEYNAGRTFLMLRLKDESEDRRMQIESLIDQLSGARLGKPSVDKDTGEILSSHEEIEAETQKMVSDKKVKDTLPRNLQQAEENGNCDIEIIEEDSDFTEQDALDNAEAGLVGHTVKIDAYAAPMHPSEENRQDKQRRKTAEKYTELIDVEAAATGIKEAGWNALLAIGKYGVSTMADITTILQSKITNNDKIATNRATAQLTALQAGGLVEKAIITDGVRAKLLIYTISPKGKKVYEYKYGVSPVISEAERLRAENDNIQHGYGIKALQEVLQEQVDEQGKKMYTSVTISRAKNTIALENGKKYIPDVKAGNGAGIDFFEYEIGITPKTDFEIKLNKMCQVTQNIHLVFPNVEMVNRNAVKVEEWIQSRGGTSLKGVVVFLYASRSINKLGLANGWISKYNCENGPIRINMPDMNSSEVLEREE